MSKTSLSFTLATLSILVLAGCAKEEVSSEHYSYSMEVNGCKTGEQKADSQAGYCRNLADDAKNNHCAYSMRKDAFDKGCANSGVDWPSTEFDAVAAPTSEATPPPAGETGGTTSSSSSEESYTYSFTMNGCATGSHSAASKIEYCRNLADDELNQDCASSLRKQAFDQACAGSGVTFESTADDAFDAAEVAEPTGE